MTCPLCGAVAGAAVAQVAYAKIWSALASEYGAVFDREVVGRHTPAEDVFLIECRDCGLHYFRPAVPGDSDFYRQLASSSKPYYNEEKWDFRAASDRLVPGVAVLDVACGSGAWLKVARAKGAEVCGVDTNPAAIAQARAAGLTVHLSSVDAFAEDHAERFDVVTAFQVIEHIPAVQPFILAAKRCLKPRGELIVTVPNRLRRFRGEFEVLDHPPHHLSHWTDVQLAVLARLTNLSLRAVQFEPGRMGDCRALLRKRVAPRRQGATVWARAVGRIAFAPSLYKLYGVLGLLESPSLRGMSLLAAFGKQ